MSLDGPVAGFFPETDEDLAKRFRSQGYSEQDFQRAMQDHNSRCNEMVQRGIMVVGQKPKQGDTNFSVIPIPGTRLAIRIWDGGADAFRLYMMDFFDLDERTAINCPPGYSIYMVPTPGTTDVSTNYPLYSWETEFGNRPEDILPGEEKFCVPEGSRWRLVRGKVPQSSDFFFCIPLRSVSKFASPVPFHPGSV
ncbi:hypothetical protein EDD16DRAFT_206823 [Pisolithus croceorrhizus]|nr:hypothetical protein EDD16DRAFT_206823 [Pisolithus croceorrhizus]KAI6117449.1 hypothetical protein EV401DRAFT_1595991 [Pisolithus croceorrhizus]KAI6150164.1 hypothetical protein EDD17DRAFT_1639470 [Pisolithus thermaeus]